MRVISVMRLNFSPVSSGVSVSAVSSGVVSSVGAGSAVSSLVSSEPPQAARDRTIIRLSKSARNFFIVILLVCILGFAANSVAVVPSI